MSVTPTVAGSGKTFTISGFGKTTTRTFDVNPGALNHFDISTILSPQVVGTAITGITLTAKDLYNNTITSFTSSVTYSGTAGVTGSSPRFQHRTVNGCEHHANIGWYRQDVYCYRVWQDWHQHLYRQHQRYRRSIPDLPAGDNQVTGLSWHGNLPITNTLTIPHFA